MKSFNTYDNVQGLEAYRKITITKAKQMTEEFEVDTLEGTMHGKVGDYLMQGIEGELYICDQDIFNETYVKI